MRSTACLLLTFLALLSLNAHAQTSSRDMKKEAVIWEQLRVTAPELLDTFKEGTVKMDAGDHKAAAALYEKVVAAAPDFDPALRRLGLMLAESGDVKAGLAKLERAVEIKRSSENLATLAQILAIP